MTAPLNGCSPSPFPPFANGDGEDAVTAPKERRHPSSEPANSGPAADAGRDERGRFIKGNKGGPGNPVFRRLARLRTEFINAVGDGDIRDVVAGLLAKAKKGDVPAATLFLAYAIGKPAQAPDPDDADQDEWRRVDAYPSAFEATRALLDGVLRRHAVEIAEKALPADGEKAAERALQTSSTAAQQIIEERKARRKKR
jgi:hypothetical protein